MKLRSLSFVFLFILFLYFPAFALEPLSDSFLSNITGRAGVSITIDDVLIVQHIGEIKYTDTDGTLGNPGSIVIGGQTMIMRINAITDGRDDDLQYNYRDMDLDGSGAYADIIEDIDGDGHMDISEDIDGDGRLDVAEDTNGNGILDAGEDLDGDGHLDIAEDVDSDGRLDVAESDINNDGFFADIIEKGAGPFEKFSPLTIDVGTCSVLSSGIQNNFAGITTTHKTDIDTLNAEIEGNAKTEIEACNELLGNGIADSLWEARYLLEWGREGYNEDISVAGVVIHLPTIEIHTEASSLDIGVSMPGAVNDGLNYIRLEQNNSTMTVLSGTIEITAH